MRISRRDEMISYDDLLKEWNNYLDQLFWKSFRRKRIISQINCWINIHMCELDFELNDMILPVRIIV